MSSIEPQHELWPAIVNNWEVLEKLCIDLCNLIVETRIPVLNNRGYGAGDHCPPHKGRIGHVCDVSNPQCHKHEVIIHHMLKAVKNSVFQVEVLMLPDCCADVKVSEHIKKKDYLLLERWSLKLIYCDTETTIEIPQLLRAVQSFLYFSQLSAWFSSSMGKSPSNIHYWIKEKFDFSENAFTNIPETHLFPICKISDTVCASVQALYLPRIQYIPTIPCSKHPPLSDFSIKTVSSKLDICETNVLNTDSETLPSHNLNVEVADMYKSSIHFNCTNFNDYVPLFQSCDSLSESSVSDSDRIAILSYENFHTPDIDFHTYPHVNNENVGLHLYSNKLNTLQSSDSGCSTFELNPKTIISDLNTTKFELLNKNAHKKKVQEMHSFTKKRKYIKLSNPLENNFVKRVCTDVQNDSKFILCEPNQESIPRIFPKNKRKNYSNVKRNIKYSKSAAKKGTEIINCQRSLLFKRCPYKFSSKPDVKKNAILMGSSNLSNIIENLFHTFSNIESMNSVSLNKCLENRLLTDFYLNKKCYMPIQLNTIYKTQDFNKKLSNLFFKSKSMFENNYFANILSEKKICGKELFYNMSPDLFYSPSFNTNFNLFQHIKNLPDKRIINFDSLKSVMLNNIERRLKSNSHSLKNKNKHPKYKDGMKRLSYKNSFEMSVLSHMHTTINDKSVNVTNCNYEKDYACSSSSQTLPFQDKAKSFFPTAQSILPKCSSSPNKLANKPFCRENMPILEVPLQNPSSTSLCISKFNFPFASICNNLRGFPSLKPNFPKCQRLLLNFEESLLGECFPIVSFVNGFHVEIGASGSFFPNHLRLPANVYFYEPENIQTSSAYMAKISLENCEYYLPKKGAVQVTLFNPSETVVRMFVVNYDFSNMQPMYHTFIRQKTYYLPVDTSSENQILVQKWLRFIINLRFASSKLGKIFLHKDIKIAVLNKSSDDAASELSQQPRELCAFTSVPMNPTFSNL